MDLDRFLKTGMQTEADFLVREHDAAAHIGSGSLRVLATPRMVAFIEQTAHHFLEGLLPEGFTNVGIWVDIHHLAATPVGGKVEIACAVTSIDGSKVTFSVQVRDNYELVGEGTHQRAVVSLDRFMRRVKEKAQQLHLE